MTISLGLAEFDRPHETRSQLLQRADVALYLANQSGRNRACLADPADADKLAGDPA